MINFQINNYYIQHDNLISMQEILDGIKLSNDIINLFRQRPNQLNKKVELIGVGNDANGKVYSLLDTKFCLKVSPLGNHVGKNQELQFEINEKGLESVKGKSVTIEGVSYSLDIIPTVAVAIDNQNAYSLLIRHDNLIRLWDEENIPFVDKDNWAVIREIKDMIRDYGGESFLAAMDINGNNLLVDIEKKKIYLIDPYVPE